MNNNSGSDYGALLNPPLSPFAPNSRDNLSINSATNLSLSVNYIPSKFSATRASSGGLRNRKGPDSIPKRGGGLDAFRSGEARMPQGKGQMRWTKFKWILFFSNILVRLLVFLLAILLMLG